MSERSDGDACSDNGLSRILQSLNISRNTLAMVNQVHGVTIVEAHEGGDADGIITNRPGISLGIRTADCVPVYVAAPQSRAIGLFHAGRAGTMQEIVVHGIRKMQECYDINPGDLSAYIGPSAGPCCYEVTEEIAQDYSQRGWDTQGRNLNLWDANIQQLIAAGVPNSQIDCSNQCTICSRNFFSYRNGDTTARNIAILTL